VWVSDRRRVSRRAHLDFNDDTFVEPGGRALIAKRRITAMSFVDIQDAPPERSCSAFPGVLPWRAGPTSNYPDDASWPNPTEFHRRRRVHWRNPVSSATMRFVRQYGTSGVCRHDPPTSFGGGQRRHARRPTGASWSVRSPASGSTRSPPTEAALVGSRADRLPVRPQPLPGDRVLLADYSSPGHIIVMDRHASVLWRYGPTRARASSTTHRSRSSSPTATSRPTTTTATAVVVIDPHTGKIIWQYGHTDEPGTAPG